MSTDDFQEGVFAMTIDGENIKFTYSDLASNSVQAQILDKCNTANEKIVFHHWDQVERFPDEATCFLYYLSTSIENRAILEFSGNVK